MIAHRRADRDNRPLILVRPRHRQPRTYSDVADSRFTLRLHGANDEAASSCNGRRWTSLSSPGTLMHVPDARCFRASQSRPPANCGLDYGSGCQRSFSLRKHLPNEAFDDGELRCWYLPRIMILIPAGSVYQLLSSTTGSVRTGAALFSGYWPPRSG